MSQCRDLSHGRAQAIPVPVHHAMRKSPGKTVIDERQALDDLFSVAYEELRRLAGKSVRSVQRWEVSLRLPVRRIRTPDGQIVYAEAPEIDAWRRKLDSTPLQGVEELPETDAPAETLPAPGTPQRVSRLRGWLLAACGMALFTGGGATGWWLTHPVNAAVDINYVGRTIEAVGRDGRVAWTYQFDGDVSAP